MPDDLLAQNIALDDDALLGDDVVDDNPMYALPVDEEDIVPEKTIPHAPAEEEPLDDEEDEESDLDGDEDEYADDIE